MNGKNSLLVGLIVLVGISGFAVFYLQHPTEVASTATESVAPDITTKTLDGQPWRLRDQKGKVLVLDYWATWCGPCVASLPHMRQVYERFKSNPDFEMVGVSQDNDAEPLRTFVERQKIPWLQLYDPAQPLARYYRIGGIPSVWVFDREGHIAGSHLEASQLEAIVAAQLARK